jgi:hypothetical protein
MAAYFHCPILALGGICSKICVLTGCWCHQGLCFPLYFTVVHAMDHVAGILIFQLTTDLVHLLEVGLST